MKLKRNTANALNNADEDMIKKKWTPFVEDSNNFNFF